jgi:hypothetical protein
MGHIRCKPERQLLLIGDTRHAKTEVGTNLGAVILDRAARPLVKAKIRRQRADLPSYETDRGIRQIRTTAWKPAMPAVVLQQQSEPKRRRASLASQQVTILVKESPELDQLVDIIRTRLHARTSFPCFSGPTKTKRYWGS